MQGRLHFQALDLTVCCAVQNRRMEQEEKRGELKINKQSPA